MYVPAHPGGMGFSLNPVKAVKSGVKAVGKGAKAVGKGAKAVGKVTGKALVKVGNVTVDLALLPAKEMLKISLTAGKVLCGLPQPVQVAAATAAGIPIPVALATIPVFCNIVNTGKIKSLSDLKRMIPIVLQIVAKVAVARQQVASEAQAEAQYEEIQEQAQDAGVDAITSLIEQQAPGAAAAARFAVEAEAATPIRPQKPVRPRSPTAMKSATSFAKKLAAKLTPARAAAMKRAVSMLKAQGRIDQAAKIEAQLRVAGELTGACVMSALNGFGDADVIGLANAEEAMGGLNETEIQLLAGLGAADPNGVKDVVDAIPEDAVKRFFSPTLAYGVVGGTVVLAAGLGLYYALRDA